jgi:phosphatidylserine/phosphatidylglycerophosphate/cardiolipin synthase-like enzyme
MQFSTPQSDTDVMRLQNLHPVTTSATHDTSPSESTDELEEWSDAETSDDFVPPKPTIERAGVSQAHTKWCQLLDQLSTSGGAQATHVEDLFDTDTSLRRRHEVIANAKHTITFSSYCISADKVGLGILDALIAAAKRGVKVVGNVSWVTQEIGNRFVLEGAGKESYAAYAMRLSELEKHGALLSYHGTPSHFLDNFGAGNHFKALVADSEVAIVGGRNIVNFEFDPAKPMLDQDMLLKGPIAAKVDREMLRILSRAEVSGFGFGDDFPKRSTLALLKAAVEQRLHQVEKASALTPAKTTDAKVWPIVWDPTYDPGHFGYTQNPITLAYVATINAAEKEVIITGNFFNDAGDITAAVIAAAKRGVKVKIVTWGEKNSTGPAEWLYIRASSGYAALHEAGVEIYETDTPQHSKMIMADGKMGAWGSYNCDLPGEEKLVEGTFFTNDSIILTKMRWAAQFIMSQCDQLTDQRNEELSKRQWPWYKRLFAATLGRVV